MVKRSKSCMDKNDAGEMEKQEKKGSRRKGKCSGAKGRRTNKKTEHAYMNKKWKQPSWLSVCFSWCEVRLSLVADSG